MRLSRQLAAFSRWRSALLLLCLYVVVMGLESCRGLQKENSSLKKEIARLQQSLQMQQAASHSMQTVDAGATKLMSDPIGPDTRLATSTVSLMLHAMFF